MNITEALRQFELGENYILPIIRAGSPIEASKLWKPLREEIKLAYKKLAFKLHPDRGGSNANFVLLKEAWDFLSNPDLPVKVWSTNRVQPVKIVFTNLDFTDSSSTGTTNSVTTGFGGFNFGTPAYTWRM